MCAGRASRLLGRIEQAGEYLGLKKVSISALHTTAELASTTPKLADHLLHYTLSTGSSLTSRQKTPKSPMHQLPLANHSLQWTPSMGYAVAPERIFGQAKLASLCAANLRQFRPIETNRKVMIGDRGSPDRKAQIEATSPRPIASVAYWTLTPCSVDTAVPEQPFV